MNRGEIYHVDLFGRSGHEQGGDRPALIVSNDVFNARVSWKTTIVVPISTSAAQAQRDYGVVLPAGSGGLTNESIALIHQVTTVDRTRFGRYYGKLDPALMARIDTELKIILYLP